ncbi:glutamate-5-semialdehyde dehydrogenase [Desulfosediminicola flagellatus]|uniref:glutamate-5-semialdehyde dehydrogenase n=1 Tax=Desulfosediminicola flagellatus TaxID=2569541 RepID=UPI0010AB69A0|nr:glutamate-5-semialdehyde dehydrogenase [Desulfosediminicola flagellatus]
MTEISQLENTIMNMAADARKAATSLISLSSAKKNIVLERVASLLDSQRTIIQSENEKDLKAGKEKGLSAAMLDRLELSDAVIDSMISGLKEVCALPDPVGSVDNLTIRPNGIQVGRMRIPLGVIAMIYESRPNVTIDAAALCLKTGNAVLLRGGSEAIHSNLVLAKVLQQALEEEGLARESVQVIPVTDRSAVQFLLQQEETIDLVIPRGGEGLIRYVSENSRIPVLKHYKGVCHIYVDKDADLEKSTPVILNAKTHRPGVCNALEGVLVHQTLAADYIPVIVKELTDAGVEVRGCAKTVNLSPLAVPAQESDWGTEFLDLKIVMKVVSDVEAAKEYIFEHGSKHTEVILTENYTTAQQFVAQVDASAVMVNASTRFNDGGQLGLGTEIGISTTKLHAYGPMGLEELTTRKFVVYGQGQIRN